MTAWFANLSIRNRFVLPIAAMMLVFAAFIMFFFPSRQRAASEEALKNKARSITQMVAYSVATGLEFEDQESVLQVFNWAQADEDLVYIVVRDAEGREFASYPADGEFSSEDPGIPRDFESTKTEKTLEIVGPVRRDGKVTGSIQLGLSTERISAQHRSSLRTALLFSLAVGIFAFATTVVVGRQVTAPILDLTKTAEEIASHDMKQLAEETRVMASVDLTGEIVVNPRRSKSRPAARLDGWRRRSTSWSTSSRRSRKRSTSSLPGFETSSFTCKRRRTRSPPEVIRLRAPLAKRPEVTSRPPRRWKVLRRRFTK